MPISAMYDGFPLLLLPPDLDAQAVQKQTNIDTDNFEGDAGSGINITHATLPKGKEQITYLCKTRAELDQLEQFIRALEGRANCFWLPTWADDLIVTTSNGTFFTIRDLDYNQSMFPIIAKRTVFIVSQSDYTSWDIRTVYDVDEPGGGVEQLFADALFGTKNGATSANHRFMFLRFMRLDSDDVVIEYLDGEKSLVTLTLQNSPADYPPWNTQGITQFLLTGAGWGDGTWISTPEPGGVPGDSRQSKTLMDTVTVPADANQADGQTYISPVAEVEWDSVPLLASLPIQGPATVFLRFTTGTAQNNWRLNGFQARMWVIRGGVPVYGPFSSNFGNGWIAIGPVQLTFPYVDFTLQDNDQIRIGLFGHLLLRSGVDGGGRPWINWGAGGGPYWSLAYFPGTIQAA